MTVEDHKGEGLVHGSLEGSLDGHDSLLVSQTIERGVLYLQDLLTYPQRRCGRLGSTALRLHERERDMVVGGPIRSATPMLQEKVREELLLCLSFP